MIDIETLEKLANNNIEHILSSLNIIYRIESGYVCIQCPFHEGDGYNLRFKNGFWYCFSQCQRKYNTINVVQKVMDLEFGDAIKWICNELGINENSLGIDQTKLSIKNKLKKLKSMKSRKHGVEYKQVDQSVLNSIDKCVPQYLLDQGFQKNTIKHFDIGYARTGTLINRICFPIDAPDGTIISVSGRLPNASELGLPKYKIVQGTDKSFTLYNISRIDPDDNYVIVVEGFKSVMSLYEWGFKSCVALMGAFPSKIQRNILLSLARHIIVVTDADEAGKRMGQSVYNQCNKFCKVDIINIDKFALNEKDSPCESDIGFDNMCELVDKIKEVI